MDNFKPLKLFGEGKDPDLSSDISEIPKEGEISPEDNALMINETDTETTNDSNDGESEENAAKRGSDKSLYVIDEQEDEQSSSKCIDCDNGSVAKMEEMMQQLMEQVSSMERLFKQRIIHTEYEEKIIDQMHSELQKYKEDLYSQLVRPILLDVIEVRDSIISMASTYLEKPEGEQDIPNKTFAAYSYDLQDILEKNNVEIYKGKCGDLFVPVRQKAIKKEITNDESLHGKIAASLSSGYSYGGHVISSEKVSVYFYQETSEENKEREDTVNG